MSTFRYILAWLPMVVLAIINGIVREAAFIHVLSDQHTHQLSTLTLIVLFTGYVWLLHSRWPLRSYRQAVVVGMIWLGLTIIFEFALGLFISGLTWQDMIASYNLLSGNLWALVPLTVGALPVLMYHLYHKISR